MANRSGFTIEDARRVEYGMTGSEVIAIMGEPYSKNVTVSHEIWVWVDVDSTPNYFSSPSYNSKTFSVIIKNGRVSLIN